MHVMGNENNLQVGLIPLKIGPVNNIDTIRSDRTSNAEPKRASTSPPMSKCFWPDPSGREQTYATVQWLPPIFQVCKLYITDIAVPSNFKQQT